jgi:sugar phosphate permease
MVLQAGGRVFDTYTLHIPIFTSFFFWQYRWLFIVEAVPTIVLGLLSFIVLPDMPSSAGRWLTDKERQVAIMRTKQSGNTDAKKFDKKQFLAALIDYKIWLSGKT